MSIERTGMTAVSVCTLLLLVALVIGAGNARADTAIGTSPGGHYVSYRNTPLLMVGESGTQCVLQNANLDSARWVEDCAALGLNTLHVWSFVAPRQQLDGSDVEDRYGYVYPGLTPWARRDSGPRAHDGGYQWDLRQWDEGDTLAHYWPRLRALCAHAQERGLLMGITVFWGWPKHPNDWAYHPFNVLNGGPVSDTPNPHVSQVQRIAAPGAEVWEESWSDGWPVAKKNQWLWERFAEKLIRETAAFDNIFFVFMDEHSYDEGNGGDHFRAFFQDRGARWVDWEQRRAAVDFVFDPVTYKDDTVGRNPEVVEWFYRKPVRPFLILEGPPYQGESVRVGLWSALMGGAGFVFHADADQETVHTGIMAYDPHVPGGDTGAERRAWLGHASRFFNNGVSRLDAMAPANALVGPGVFCLAEPGQQYAVYLTPGADAEIQLDLSQAPGDFSARWYNPRTGAWREPVPCAGGQAAAFAKPGEGDWALLVAHDNPAFELPPGFDPEAYYLPATTNMGSPDSPRGAAALAEGLVAHGTVESLALAEEILAAVLHAQETREGAAHRGNFLWTFRAEAIGDLNSVEFTLRHLIPLVIAHGDRLSTPTREHTLAAIRLGLEEIARMNVAITYTNVATMDCMNSILGGELLEDAAIAGRGYARLKELERDTLSHGTFCEFNTPTYTRVTHDALSQIATYTRNDEAGIRARALRARLALTAALHVHPRTGLWAGPQGRGHRYATLGAIEPERLYLDRWVEMGRAPRGFAAMLEDRPLPYTVWESVYPARNLGAMTYLGDAFTMGTAVREISRQSDVFLVHGTKADGAPPAIVYSKYRIDDPGDLGGAETDADGLIPQEEGKFYGVQWGTRAIGLYAPRTSESPGSVAPTSANRFQSAKAVIEFTRRAPGDRVWVGPDLVTQFPRDFAPGEVAVVECGEAYIAILPLDRDDLGFGAPLRLVQRADRLALEMYNYLGPETVFWDMDRESRFFQGKPRAGFYAEVAPASAYASGAAFARAVAAGTLNDEADPPVTSYHDNTERLWTVEYDRDGQILGIQIDLINWTLKRRWNADADLGWPLMESPIARQTDTGRVEVGGAVVECGAAPAWLFALPERGGYVAGYHGDPAPFTLRTPEGSVSLDTMGTGTVSWCDGKVTVDAIRTGEPVIERVGG